MALYEQFTVPYNRYVDSNEVAAGAPRQHGTRDCYYTYTSYTIPTTFASADTIDCDVNTNVKLSSCSAVVSMDEAQIVRTIDCDVNTNVKLSSSIDSLSTCSAVVSMDEAQMIRMQEAAEYSSPSFISKCGMEHEDWSSHKKAPKVKETDVNDTSDRFRECNDGLASVAGSLLSGPEIRETELNGNMDVYQRKSYGRSAECRLLKESIGECTQESAVDGQQADAPFIGSVADANMPIQKRGSLCDKMKSSMVVPPPASTIKPKDVIHAVGQHLFWKARKAILRQQEIFSNQVFELHKLIKVQKLLAKMPSTLIDDHLLLETTSGKHGRGCKRDSDEQGNLADRRVTTLAPKRCGGHTRRSKAQRRSVSFEESEGRVVGSGVHAKKSFHVSTRPQVSTNTPLGQPCQFLSSDGMSAWGYPMRPYPPGAGNFPSGSAYGGGEYVVGPNPQPVISFAFPCYGQGPPEQTSAVCPNNQWPSPMYHNVFPTPVLNEWFAMNHRGQGPPASVSEKADFAPSINMKAEASTRSAQPSVVPCLQQIFGMSSCTRSLGSYATSSASRLPNSLSRKLGSDYVGEQDTALSPDSGRVFAQGASGGRNKVDTDLGGQAKGVQERGQLPTTSSLPRQDGVGVDNSSGGHALNLFPLQPSSSMGGHSVGRVALSVVARHDAGCQGQVIKAVPRSALAASESTAGILLSIQRERQL